MERMEKATQREHSGLGIIMNDTIIMKPEIKKIIRYKDR